MLSNLIGVIWIGMGGVFLFKPELLRKRLQRKSWKSLRWQLFLATLFLSGLIIGATAQVPGILARIVTAFGIIGLFKAFFFLKARAAQNLVEWYAGRSLIFFRIGAVFQVIFGLILILS